MINGLVTIDLSSQAGVYILTALQGQVDQQANHSIQFIGLLTADIAIRIPSVAQTHTFFNGTTGGFSLNIGTTGNTAYKLTSGHFATIICDGTLCFDDRNYIAGPVTFGQNIAVTGNVAAATLSATGNVSIGGTATVAALAVGNVTSTGALSGTSLTITGNSTLSGNVAAGALAVGGGASVGTNLGVVGNIGANGIIYFGGSTGNTIGTNSLGTRYISGGTPSVAGANADIWYQIV